MISLLQLRKKEPTLERPFKVPLYPITPIVALVIASVSLVAMIVYNRQLAGIYLSLLVISFIWYKISKNNENIR